MAGATEVTELSIGGVDYVVRVEPTGLMESPLPTLSLLAAVATTARRLLRRDRTWTITVRTRAHDPFGPVVHREVVPSRADATERLEQLVDRMRTQPPPWLGG